MDVTLSFGGGMLFGILIALLFMDIIRDSEPKAPVVDRACVTKMYGTCVQGGNHPQTCRQEAEEICR